MHTVGRKKKEQEERGKDAREREKERQSCETLNVPEEMEEVVAAEHKLFNT